MIHYVDDVADIQTLQVALRSGLTVVLKACDTCRLRKQKCDEQRPKCGLCQRLKLECSYREPTPIKKDQTVVEILGRLKSLEGKVDRIPIRAPLPPGFALVQPSPASQPSASSPRLSQQPSQPSRQVFSVHKMLTWPTIQRLLL